MQAHTLYFKRKHCVYKSFYSWKVHLHYNIMY